MEAKITELEKEDCQYQLANIPEACCSKITECEQELNKQGYWNIALVAYQLER